MTDLDLSAHVRRLVDRDAIAASLTGYAVACDERDRDSLREIFHADARAFYDNYEEVTVLEGGATIVEWIIANTAHLKWQQHALRVMSIDVDEDTAHTVSYLTSHQTTWESPDTALMMNSRYDVDLVRTGASWQFTSLRLEIGTVEFRPVQAGSIVANRKESQHV